jgi:hypothetical protein
MATINDCAPELLLVRLVLLLPLQQQKLPGLQGQSLHCLMHPRHLPVSNAARVSA